ncbi:MAG: hypothetical protein MKZ67_12030, partial [Acidimicrobiales bacterium]|nr:hypothetical protein [Acidimicrobiales bacterium]
DGSVQFENRTNAVCTLGVWGPRAVELLSTLTESDLNQSAFPYGTCQEILMAGIPTEMFRVSYVGDAGFELYTPMQHGLALWDAIATAGEAFDLRPVGAAVYGTSGWLEKGYRLMGSELEDEYTPVEAGLARPKVKAADFIGKEAYMAARQEDPCAQLCVLTMESLTCEAGYERFPMGAGNEPILSQNGDRIIDSKGRVSRVTTAGNAPSLDKYLLMAYLPTDLCGLGTELQVMYQNELYPVKVAATGPNLALFDPSNDRMKA